MMKKYLLRESDENTCLITLEFLEDGYLLKTGQRSVHRCELDVIVRNDITCDQLLAGIYAGIRDILIKKYHLDVSEKLGQTAYTRENLPYEARAAVIDRTNQRLRPRIKRELVLRSSAMRYRANRRKAADMEKRYSFPSSYAPELSEQEQDMISWMVCWQVFHECYTMYAIGYPGSEKDPHGDTVRDERYACHPIISRGTVNLRSVHEDNFPMMADKPQLWLEKRLHGSKTLRELGFVTSTRVIFDPVLWHQASRLFDERMIERSFREYAPVYNISGHPVIQISEEQITVFPPVTPPELAKRDPLPLVLSPVINTGASFLILMLTDAVNSLLTAGLMAAVMSVTTLGVGYLAGKRTEDAHRRDLKQWAKQYEQYICKLIGTIVERQSVDRDRMLHHYPPAYDPHTEADLLRRAMMINGAIFSRTPDHPDFLCVRIGTSTPESQLVPARFPIIGMSSGNLFLPVKYRNISSGSYQKFELLLPDGESENDAFDGYLQQLPEAISREYAYLSDAPVLMDLYHARVAGLVCYDRKKEYMPFISNMLMDLCFHQSPDQLQIIMICPETELRHKRQDFAHRFKHLPHFRQLLQNHSSFAFDQAQSWQIYDLVWSIMKQRQRHEDGGCHPHILMILLQEYDLKKHPLSSLIPSHSSQMREQIGLTFFFCKHSEEALPACSETVICCKEDNTWSMLPYVREDDSKERTVDSIRYIRYQFRPDEMLQDSYSHYRSRDLDLYYRAFKTLSALHHRQNFLYFVPAYWDLFRIIATHTGRDVSQIPVYDAVNPVQTLRSIHAFLTNYIHERRNQERKILTSVAVPMGRGGSLINVDLCDWEDGPNMLISGDRGTGKTSCILTYLLLLAANYRPEDVRIALVDVHGSNLSGELRDLPHVEKIFEDTEYTVESIQTVLQELIQWLDAQISHRHILLSQMGVGDIQEYALARSDLEHHIRTKLHLHPLEDATQIQKLEQMESMPHLFVAMDDLDKLAQYAASVVGSGRLELCNQLHYLLQHAADLGIHLIASTEMIAHTIPQTLMSIFSVRICMKCSDPQAWDCVDAWDPSMDGEMPGNGRAWICNKRKGYADYVQIGYPHDDISTRQFAPYQLTLSNPGVAHQLFFDSEEYVREYADEPDAENLIRTEAFVLHGVDPTAAAEAHMYSSQDQDTIGDRRTLPTNHADESDEESYSSYSGDRRSIRSPKKHRHRQEPQEILLERPDAILFPSSKAGISQAECLVSEICRYDRSGA